MVLIKNFTLLFVVFFTWKLSDGQTITMSAPGTAKVNDPLTLTCTYTPTGGQSVTSYKWTYTSASTVLRLDSSCNVAFGGSITAVTYTKTCTGNTFTLDFPATSSETINREWCCNVAVDTGSAPTDPGDCKTIDLDCGSLTNPSGGTVSTPTTIKEAEATYTCNEGYTMEGSNKRKCQTVDGTWSGSAPTCTADTPTPCCDCFCKVWCIVLVVIVIIYGTSWIVASVVNLVIYNMNQMRLPWHLCDGNLKKWQSWLLLFIFVPYVPSGVAIYLFNTKRPGYCRCVGAPGTDISINFKYTVSSSGEVTVQVKNEAGTILVSVKFIDGKVAGKADINPRVDFTRNVTTGDMSFKLNNIQTSDSGLYTLSGNDVPCSCVELFVTDKPTSGTEMNKFGTP